jgi:putative oxidoreductase
MALALEACRPPMVRRVLWPMRSHSPRLWAMTRPTSNPPARFASWMTVSAIAHKDVMAIQALGTGKQMTLNMPQMIAPLRFALAAIAVVLCIASLYAIATNPIPAWTSIVIVVLLSIMIGGVVQLMRQPQGPFFQPLVILLPGLIVGRLLSTIWPIQVGQPAPKVDELLLGETGPGIPLIEPLTLVLVAVASLYVLAQARRSITTSSKDASFSASDWLVTILRTYVGLMFISHFTGHVLAGPIPFNVFVGYFGHIGMPLPAASVVLAGLIEIAVCIGLAFGLLTRPLAALGAFYVLFAVGIGGHFSIGYSWAMPGLGWEFPALWSSALALFAIFGAGPISMDAKLGLRK